MSMRKALLVVVALVALTGCGPTFADLPLPSAPTPSLFAPM